jgi:hypothetical protein
MATPVTHFRAAQWKPLCGKRQNVGPLYQTSYEPYVTCKRCLRLIAKVVAAKRGA